MSITVMICFSRSGGTVLNRCLGSLPNVVIMSEVNPVGGGKGSGEVNYSTVKDQAKHWYGIDLKSEGFTENILELYNYCVDNGKHLIIRDFPYINFVPSPLNNKNASNSFSTLEALNGKVDLKHFAFVRDSIDSWVSFGAKKPRKYFRYYKKYVQAVIDADMPFFKYEDFCTDTDETMKAICNYAGLEYSESYKNYGSFTTVNGDVGFQDSYSNTKGGSRGLKEDSIKLLPRRRIMFKSIFQLNRNKDMIESNKLFGYPTYYSSSQLEEFNLSKAVKRFFGV